MWCCSSACPAAGQVGAIGAAHVPVAKAEPPGNDGHTRHGHLQEPLAQPMHVHADGKTPIRGRPAANRALPDTLLQEQPLTPLLAVRAGEGRLLKCLRDHKDDLGAECAAEDTKLAILQSQDIRLTPRLHQLCSGEVAAYCKDVKPGTHTQEGTALLGCVIL